MASKTLTLSPNLEKRSSQDVEFQEFQEFQELESQEDMRKQFKRPKRSYQGGIKCDINSSA